MPTDIHFARKNFRTACLWVPLSALGLAAHAQSSDGAPYDLYVSQQLVRDTNVLRAPIDQAVEDTISGTTVGFMMDQVFGRQRFKGEASLQVNRFRQEHDLDNNAPYVKAEWGWQAGDRWEGELGLSHASSLYRYYLNGDSGQSNQVRNMQTDNLQYFRARLGVVTALTWQAEWSHYQRDYSADLYRNQNQTRNTVATGLRYQPQPDLSASLDVRHTAGQYPDFSATLGADDYTRWDLEALLNLQVSAASLLNLRLAHTTEDHSLPAAAGGPHWTGSVGWRWQPTGKLSFNTRLVRDSDTSDQWLAGGTVNTAQSRQTTQLVWDGQWALTGKIKLGLAVQQNWRRLQSSTTGLGEVAGRDRMRSVALQLGYQPIDAVSLGCNVSREVQDVSGASGLTYPYHANVVSCSGRLDWR